jgi:hypothetical protein
MIQRLILIPERGVRVPSNPFQLIPARTPLWHQHPARHIRAKSVERFQLSYVWPVLIGRTVGSVPSTTTLLASLPTSVFPIAVRIFSASHLTSTLLPVSKKLD